MRRLLRELATHGEVKGDVTYARRFHRHRQATRSRRGLSHFAGVCCRPSAMSRLRTGNLIRCAITLTKSRVYGGARGFPHPRCALRVVVALAVGAILVDLTASCTRQTKGISPSATAVPAATISDIRAAHRFSARLAGLTPPRNPRTINRSISPGQNGAVLP